MFFVCLWSSLVDAMSIRVLLTVRTQRCDLERCGHFFHLIVSAGFIDTSQGQGFWLFWVPAVMDRCSVNVFFNLKFHHCRGEEPTHKNRVQQFKAGCNFVLFMKDLPVGSFRAGRGLRCKRENSLLISLCTACNPVLRYGAEPLHSIGPFAVSLDLEFQ